MVSENLTNYAQNSSGQSDKRFYQVRYNKIQRPIAAAKIRLFVGAGNIVHQRENNIYAPLNITENEKLNSHHALCMNILKHSARDTLQCAVV